jgi:hypothetical protein
VEAGFAMTTYDRAAIVAILLLGHILAFALGWLLVWAIW